MKKERYIILLTNPETNEVWAYGSLTAMVKDPQNNLNVSLRALQLALQKQGYPTLFHGKKIQRLRLLSASDIEK